MKKELEESLRKIIISGGNLNGMSILYLKFDETLYSLGIFSNSGVNNFLTFNPVIKDKSFSAFGTNGVIKHITLVDLEKWHITCDKKGYKGSIKNINKKTHFISTGIYYWFGMSVKDINNLGRIIGRREKSTKLNVDFSNIPDKDSNRRSGNLFNLLNSNLEQLKVDIDKLDYEQYYFHFEFFICDKKAKVNNLGFHSPVVDEGENHPVKIVELNKVSIRNKKVVISISQLPGMIKEPVRIWSI